jgi:hypothetical protein
LKYTSLIVINYRHACAAGATCRQAKAMFMAHPPSFRQVGSSLRMRLYAIIGFLGLLPLLGVGFGVMALQGSARDNAELDRAARGTIYLERINGLVYEVASCPVARNADRRSGRLGCPA